MLNPLAADPSKVSGLTIVGTGVVAQTLGRLLAGTGRMPPRSIISRSKDNAERLANQLGDADAPLLAHQGLDGLESIDSIVMIATADRAIRATAEALAKRRLVGPGSIVFHCSGALDSNELIACAGQGAMTASLHPLASFADPMALAAHFGGVFCVTEGDPRALQIIEPALEALGARIVRLSSGLKMAYHAGAVLASGYLVATLAAALKAEALAGIDEVRAREMLAPLVRISMENALRDGPRRAMTGPLVRGDDQIVRAHLEVLEKHDPELAACYRGITRFASQLLERTDPLGKKQ